jgi:hypothetical protein
MRMPPNYTDTVRALIRLRQLASEERLAVLRNDDAMLCRIASLLPSAINGLDSDYIRNNPALQREIHALCQLQYQIVSYLRSRMQSMDEQLKLRHRMLQTCKAYATPNRGKIAKINRIG